MSFEKIAGLQTVVIFRENRFPKQGQTTFFSMTQNELDEVPLTVGCKIPLDTVC